MERLVIPVLTPAAAATVADLAARRELEIVAVAIDVGSGASLEALRDLALASGARRCHVVDAIDTLAGSICWPVLRAGALAAPGEPVLTALTMPVVAETVVEICRLEDATAIGVWAETPGDRQRLRALLKALAPMLGLVSVSGAGAAATANLWARVVPADGPAAPAARCRAPRCGRFRTVPVALSGVNGDAGGAHESLATITGALGPAVAGAGGRPRRRRWVVLRAGAAGGVRRAHGRSVRSAHARDGRHRGRKLCRRRARRHVVQPRARRAGCVRGPGARPGHRGSAAARRRWTD
jgi:hypothetical protein